MKKFKSFLYDTVIGDPELDEIVEEIQPELDEHNKRNPNKTAGVE